MQILSSKQKINFTSTPIHYVSPRTVEGASQNAKMLFSRLDINSRTDVDAIKQIQEQTWKNDDNIKRTICRKFLGPNVSGDFFALEKQGEESLGERIVGLMNILKYKDSESPVVNISYLVSKHNYLSNPKKRQVKGVGEILLGEAVNVAKKFGARLKVFSTNDNFYLHCFENARMRLNESVMTGIYGSDFTIMGYDLDRFLKYCSKKYKVDYSVDSLE